MINNRQNGRRRGRGGQRSQGGNPGRSQDNGNRIDNRARGNAAQLLEKYKTLARDAQMQGDRVNTEYYLQFADHYFRVLAETRSRFEENQPRRGQNDQFEGDEGDDFDGNDMNNDDGAEFAHDGGQDRGNNGYRGNNGNGNGNAQRSNGNGNGRDHDRAEANAGGQYAAFNGDGADAPVAAADHRERAPRAAADQRPRRPRQAPRNADSAADDNGQNGEAMALDIDRLPPAISVAAGDDAAPAEKPRRRRRTVADEATPIS